jgi:hypothetical protein
MMTSTNGNDGSRLDRIERIVESNARAIAANADQITANSEVISSLREVVVTFIDATQTILERVDAQQSEIRGLQIENRRILDVLQRIEGEGGQG